MRKVLSILLVVAIFMSWSIPVYAATQEGESISPRYTYIKFNSAYIDINENTGVASCEASCYATDNLTVKVQCRLQRYNGSSWTTLKTWTASGTSYSGVDEVWAVSSGYKYRVYAIFRIYNSSGTLVETATNIDTYNYT